MMRGWSFGGPGPRLGPSKDSMMQLLHNVVSISALKKMNEEPAIVVVLYYNIRASPTATTGTITITCVDEHTDMDYRCYCYCYHRYSN